MSCAVLLLPMGPSAYSPARELPGKTDWLLLITPCLRRDARGGDSGLGLVHRSPWDFSSGQS